MEKMKKFIAVFLTLTVLVSSVWSGETKVDAFSVVNESGEYRISELSDSEMEALEEVSVTDKEMLEDIIERSYNNDFREKTYIIKAEGENIDSTHWIMYLKSRGDFALKINWYEGKYIAYADGYSYHAVTITPGVSFSPFDYDTRTVERWNEYMDKIREVEQNIGILDESLCDYQKIQLAYIWIEQNVKYGTLGHVSVSAGQEPIEAVLDGYAMCAGYSRVFNRFMHDCGIECYWVERKDISHAYNLVKHNGEFYKADCQVGILNKYEGYEEYNSNGKLLWEASGLFIKPNPENYNNMNEYEAIVHYNPDFVSGTKGCTPYEPIQEVNRPTCLEEGTFLKEGRIDEHCDYCGEIHSFTLPATHTWKTVEVKLPTCTKEGYVKKVCTQCGEETTEVLAKEEHDYTFGARESTCKYDGEFSIVCNTCSKEYYVESKEMAEHTMSDWVKYPRYNGYEYRYCTSSAETLGSEYREYRNIYTGEITDKKPTSDAYNPETTTEKITEKQTTVKPEETTVNGTVDPTVEETTAGETITEKATTAKPTVPETTTEKITVNKETTCTTKPVATTENIKTVKKPGRVSVKAVNIKPRKIKLSWKKVKGATKYQVKYVLGKKTVVKTVRKTMKSYTFKHLKKNKTYKVYVRVCNKAGWGKWSKVKKVKIKK